MKRLFKGIEFHKLEGFEYYYISKCGKVLADSKMGIKILNGYISNSGYHIVNLQLGSKKVARLVHRLIASTFLPPITGKEIVNHKDGDKLNNNLENIEWSNPSENHLHRCRVLKKGIGEDQHLAKLNSEKVRLLRKMFTSKKPRAEIARHFGIDIRTVYTVGNRETWRHVDD